MRNKCGRCGYRLPNGACAFTNQPVTEEDFCSKFKNAPYKCDYCGRLMVGGGTLNPIEENDYQLLCDECLSKLGTCGLCQNATYCAFEMDSSCTEPKQVQQSVRQGNMVMQTMIMNPVRIEKTCKVKCMCFDKNEGCLRQTVGFCNKYK